MHALQKAKAYCANLHVRTSTRTNARLRNTPEGCCVCAGATAAALVVVFEARGRAGPVVARLAGGGCTGARCPDLAGLLLYGRGGGEIGYAMLLMYNHTDYGRKHGRKSLSKPYRLRCVGESVSSEASCSTCRLAFFRDSSFAWRVPSKVFGVACFLAKAIYKLLAKAYDSQLNTHIT